MSGLHGHLSVVASEHGDEFVVEGSGSEENRIQNDSLAEFVWFTQKGLTDEPSQVIISDRGEFGIFSAFTATPEYQQTTERREIVLLDWWL